MADLATAPLRADPPRWWQYVRANRIRCPAGHHVPNTFSVTEAGFVRCAHIINRHDRVRRDDTPVATLECGLWVFLLAIRGGGVVSVAVSLDDKRAMAELTTPAELLDYLGIFHR